jgi:hypothetical protein
MNSNTSSVTVSLRRREIFPAYKANRHWRLPPSTMKYECFCQLKFSTEGQLEAHIRRAHDPAGDSA